MDTDYDEREKFADGSAASGYGVGIDWIETPECKVETPNCNEIYLCIDFNIILILGFVFFLIWIRNYWSVIFAYIFTI